MTFYTTKKGELILKVDICATCLKPNSFYQYALKHNYTKLQYFREYPCNKCDIEKLKFEELKQFNKIMDGEMI